MLTILSFAGCNKTTAECPWYDEDCNKAECPDLSDIMICKNLTVPEDRRVMCDEERYFNCEDNKTCIPSSLICDGHSQCPDSSDGNPELCMHCPRPYGHPPRPESEQLLNTLTCIHRYTGRPICAIPCDGRDDLCEAFEDEKDCGGSGADRGVKILHIGLHSVLFIRITQGFLDIKIP